jgi:hypothetical protein
LAGAVPQRIPGRVREASRRALRTVKALAIAQVDYVKADLAQRIAFVKLMAIIGRP